jgi:antitoxin component YwqK of YwqJK toxin-antitoxin module
MRTRSKSYLGGEASRSPAEVIISQRHLLPKILKHLSLKDQQVLCSINKQLYVRNHTLNNGCVQYKYQYGKCDGLRTVYYTEKRNLKYIEFTMIKGKKHGGQTTYDTDGKVRYKDNFKNNMRHGLHTSYYPDGTVMSTVTYENSVMHGSFIRYDHSGRKMLLRTFNNGIDHGVYKEWYHNGKVSICGYYYKTLRHRVWKKYNLNGSLHHKERWIHGSYQA